MPKPLGNLVHPRRCGRFWTGVPIGAVGGLLLFEFPTLGVLVFSVFATLLRLRDASGRAAFGLLAGAGLPLLVVAYLNREGPGTTCWKGGSAGGCDQHLNPIPWLVIGLALVLIGSIAQTRRR